MGPRHEPDGEGPLAARAGRRLDGMAAVRDGMGNMEGATVIPRGVARGAGAASYYTY
jgi:hypothetical protein